MELNVKKKKKKILIIILFFYFFQELSQKRQQVLKTIIKIIIIIQMFLLFLPFALGILFHIDGDGEAFGMNIKIYEMVKKKKKKKKKIYPIFFFPPSQNELKYSSLYYGKENMNFLIPSEPQLLGFLWLPLLKLKKCIPLNYLADQLQILWLLNKRLKLFFKWIKFDCLNWVGK